MRITITRISTGGWSCSRKWWREFDSATTIGNSTLGMLANDFAGAVVRITRGTGATQERAVISNNATTLTVTPAWTVTPDSTSYFVVANSTWNFGGLAATSPVQIEVPNQTGPTVEISGRSANVLNQESAYGVESADAMADRRRGGGGVDTDVPPQPVFGLNLAGQGTIDLVGIAFTDSDEYAHDSGGDADAVLLE